ncbi:peptidoglycan-binding protein [Streptomyces alkaliphilus]|uniref:Peptidoglycan-binding protein n=1 Tax=Streptomyces alkaliphilus TaxID=1472722 RepID=A0A7W3TI51_9ACTN|nr:peptidoglycan-binding domain-containing protein [Streptomyces alkaliphilus]MBB0247217.1 peptidoglycan-binding protein [Streptomyces alkaliphilus]
MRARTPLALLAVTAALFAGAAVTAPAATAADTCHTQSTIGLTCHYHYGNQWAERGSVGNHVREIQALINGTTDYRQVGGRLAVDGRFGPATETAVRWFQRNHMAAGSVDGVVGPNTWRALRGYRV